MSVFFIVGGFVKNECVCVYVIFNFFHEIDFITGQFEILTQL